MLCRLLIFRLYGYVVYEFFFFKQKTAYEMRISDWSSDVCSSDLKVFKEVVPMVAAMIVAEMVKLGLEGADMRRLWLHQANTNMNRLIAQRVLGHEEIGRASRRERVCMYV